MELKISDKVACFLINVIAKTVCFLILVAAFALTNQEPCKMFTELLRSLL